MKNKFANTELEGLNIYRDRKGQKVYLDPITKNGYVIPPNKEKTFKVLENVVLYTALTGVVAYALFDFSIIVTIIIMAAVFAFLEFRWRKFLSNCTMITKFKPVKKNESEIYSSPDSMIILKIVAYLAVASLLIVTAVLDKSGNTTMFAVSIAVAVAAAFIGVKYITILYARKKH
ncbi:MAG: hypothetical protein Q4B60_05965 [Erysipelotrichaceae bacterium]|nr:hypothetical protein [Erysipelotrichaceae bacterium]